MCKLSPCPRCFDQVQQRQVGCAGCGGTGLAGARYCGGCCFIHPERELSEGRCAVCRSKPVAKRGKRKP